MLGNIRTQTFRAFTASEMEKVLAKVPLMPWLALAARAEQSQRMQRCFRRRAIAKVW